MHPVLIVGAGLSGLMAAQALTAAGYPVQVVDKGRSVGGRLATRRVGGGRADHGAQFFSVRSPRFQSQVDDWLARGWIFRWSTGWSAGSLAEEGPDGHPRYAAHGGMNRLAKRLAEGLEVQVDVELTAVQARSEGWITVDRYGRHRPARALLLTPPVPQSLALLVAGNVTLDGADRSALDRIGYAPCVAGLFHLSAPPLLPDPGALQRPGYPYSWIADNRRKGISADAILITVHAGPDWSRVLWEWPEATALDHMLEHGLAPWLEPGTHILERQLKRWRYALPERLHPHAYLAATNQPAPLLFVGDAFGGPRMEGAALSGMAAAAALIEELGAGSVAG